MLETLLLPQRFSAESIEYSGLREEIADCAVRIGEVLEELVDPIYDAASRLELGSTQVWRIFEFLVGPGLEELQRRKR